MAGAVELMVLPALSGPLDAHPSPPSHLLLTCGVRAPTVPGSVVDASGSLRSCFACQLRVWALHQRRACGCCKDLLVCAMHFKRQPLLCAVWS